ncbi:MAG TPA: VOC family protein [Iamia sp.]|nr:VOC family protein [Iamia sp.]
MERPFVIALPTADRVRAHAFHTEGLGLEAVGEPAEDGVPEPLQLRLGADVHLMLIPRGGFGWVTDPHPTAAPGTSECQLSWTVPTRAGVVAAVERARAAGARVVAEPDDRPWGYAATFADPDGHLWMVLTPPEA